ncbi:MAG: RQC domain-containing protein, partial [Bacillota bacterium]|nr:RQC domain-containing protein [Bacillota bacterium]
VVLYSSQDVQIQRFLIDQSSERELMGQELEKLQQMVDYCHTENCLQEFILRYFGETETKACGRCGNCTDARSSVDVTTDAQKVMSCVIRMGQRFGKTMIAGVLTGSKNKKVTDFGFAKLPTYGIMKDRGAKDVSDFIEFLISQELLSVEHGQFPTIFVSPKGKEVLLGKRNLVRKEAITIKQVSNDDPLFEELRTVRKKIADAAKVPPFVVFSDSALKDMCAKLPRSREEMLNVSGVGEHKLNKYGNDFIVAIIDYCEKHPDRIPQIGSAAAPPPKTKKQATGDSHLETLKMHQKGMGLSEIANIRDLAVSTVENHLIDCAQQGMEVDFKALIPKEYLSLLEQAVEKAGRDRLKPIKELLPDEISYFMIKAYLYLLREKNQV